MFLLQLSVEVVLFHFMRGVTIFKTIFLSPCLRNCTIQNLGRNDNSSQVQGYFQSYRAHRGVLVVSGQLHACSTAKFFELVLTGVSAFIVQLTPLVDTSRPHVSQDLQLLDVADITHPFSTPVWLTSFDDLPSHSHINHVCLSVHVFLSLPASCNFSTRLNLGHRKT